MAIMSPSGEEPPVQDQEPQLLPKRRPWGNCLTVIGTLNQYAGWHSYALAWEGID